jgi:transcriptional regulator GlxA family with amidase domain
VRRVLILAFDGVQSLDVTGPVEVFNAAGRVAREPYRIEIVAPRAKPIRTGSGLTLVPDRAIASVRGQIDTLLVAGGEVEATARDGRVTGWLARAAGRSRRVGSVCSGAFILAAAGLLDGRRAATHWAHSEELARLFPEVAVDPESIFVRDGDVWTSAGVTAGMDLALALVEEDLGREAALEAARWLVIYARRTGGQSQFSSHLRAQLADREPLRELQAWLPDHLGDELPVERLAERACMSPRNFARAFRRELGMTPAAYVEALRVGQARLRLESTAQKLEAVARDCGFGTVETMRRAFHRRLGVGPAEYRQRFQTGGGDGDADRDPVVRSLHGTRRRRAV